MNPEKTNSVVGTPRRGDSAYTTNEHAVPGPLDTKTTGGVVGQPGVGQAYIPTLSSNVSVSGPTGEVETTYNHENLSAKYKYPRVSQDVPAKGQNQFEDHS